MPRVGDVKATELFPELSDDINRRIAASETRIKYWVIMGILGNSIGLLTIALPLVFYLGQISTSFDSTVDEVKGIKQAAAGDGDWKRDQMVWRATAEQWMVTQGFIPPAGQIR